MSGIKWWSKFGTKLLSRLVMFSILSSDIPLDFNNPAQVVLEKYFFKKCIF